MKYEQRYDQSEKGIKRMVVTEIKIHASDNEGIGFIACVDIYIYTKNMKS